MYINTTLPLRACIHTPYIFNIIYGTYVRICKSIRSVGVLINFAI